MAQKMRRYVRLTTETSVLATRAEHGDVPLLQSKAHANSMLIYPHRLELIRGERLVNTRFVKVVKAKCMVGASLE